MQQQANSAIVAMAQQFQVDAGALQHLSVFLAEHIREKCPEFPSFPLEDQEKIIMAGVRAWYANSVKVLTELRDGRSEWAIMAREQIATEVYNTIRGQA